MQCFIDLCDWDKSIPDDRWDTLTDWAEYPETIELELNQVPNIGERFTHYEVVGNKVIEIYGVIKDKTLTSLGRYPRCNRNRCYYWIDVTVKGICRFDTLK